jgi:hypothetical protein
MNLLKANAEKCLIQPGKSYEDAQTLLMGRLFYESLSDYVTVFTLNFKRIYF